MGLARQSGWRCVTVEAADADEVMGVNSRADLAAAERVMQARLRAAALEAGVTMVDPATVYLSTDTRFGRDVTIGPHVIFGKGVTVADNVEIRAFCHIDGAAIGPGCLVGPFARLRPGARLERDVHVGNFVEMKEAVLEAGAKANHLTYIGDARVGAGANIGAGTITCNYDGFFKSRTEIGAGAFIGSNTALVAPVKVGDGAIVGRGLGDHARRGARLAGRRARRAGRAAGLGGALPRAQEGGEGRQGRHGEKDRLSACAASSGSSATSRSRRF